MNYEELSRLYFDIYNPLFQKQLEYKLQKTLCFWNEKYREIKDQSWPDCGSYEEFEFLPNHVKKECVEIHNFSPEIWKQDIAMDTFSPFSLNTPEIVQEIIDKNISFIADKRILDVACNQGHYSFACQKAGAKHVTGFDVREYNIQMANAIKDYQGFGDDKIQFLLADIHDYDQLKKLCEHKDTVLIPGILYHVHDHYQILQSVTECKVPTVIIETADYTDISKSDSPLVWWRIEPTFDPLSGWYQGAEHIPVGYPNQSWLNLIMKHLGYDLVTCHKRVIDHSKTHPGTYMQIRSWSLYEKSNNNSTRRSCQ